MGSRFLGVLGWGVLLFAVSRHSLPAAADVLVVAGQKIELAGNAFAVVGEEVYAPLLPALKHLGAKCVVGPEAIRIATATGREIVVSRTRAEATLDGVLRELPGPPRRSGNNLLVPATAIGSLLGCAVRWEAPTRTLLLHPWVRRFSVETLPDRCRVTIGAEAPLAVSTGKVEDPPRLYLDLLHADLATIPSELEGGGCLRRARIRQNSLYPAAPGDVVRVVLELTEWRPYRVSLAQDRCTLQVDFPLVGQERPAEEAGPVILTDLAFQRMSPRLAAVRLGVFGRPACESGASDSPPAVWVDLPNADNRLPTRHLDPRDRLVSAISCEPVPESPGIQRLTIYLSEPAPHQVIRERGEVRVLLGQEELSGVTVVIDPGHGGHDTGAIGRSGLAEKDVNLDIARRVQSLLDGLGARTIMTRSGDDPLVPWNRRNSDEHRRELLARCAVANEAGADLFVSIHCNARGASSAGTRGTETYYRKEDSVRLAQMMQEEMVRALGLPDGGALRHPKPIIVLYQTNMPAVLVGVAYLSHPEEEALLATQEFRQRAAEGIVAGIKRYVREEGLAGRLWAR